MADKDNNEEAVRKGTMLDYFVEKDEIWRMIITLPSLDNEAVVLERAVERFVG